LAFVDRFCSRRDRHHSGTIRSLAAADEPKGVKLPLTSHRSIESLPCKVEGVAVLGDIDIGNGEV